MPGEGAAVAALCALELSLSIDAIGNAFIALAQCYSEVLSSNLLAGDVHHSRCRSSFPVFCLSQDLKTQTSSK